MRFIAALLCIAALVPSYAQRRPLADSARVILRNAFAAQEKLKMRGTRVVEQYENGFQGKYTDHLLRDGMKVRITFGENAPNKGHVAVETPDGRMEFSPRENLIRRMKGDHSGAGVVLKRLVEAVRTGTVQLKEFDTRPIAGRRAYGVGAMTQNGLAVLKLWIDAETGLVLKTEHFSPDGTKRGGYEFTSVEYNPSIPADAFELRKPGVRVVDMEGSGAGGTTDTRPNWRVVAPSWLPPGLVEQQRAVKELRGRKVLMIHYRGGGKNLTLFQAPGGEAPEPPDKPSGTQVRFLSRKVGEIWVVAVGNLPLAQLERVLNSVR
ncbi:MAG: hypothetical protein U0R49_12375 [Fimbriimonadales bacterium]